MTQSETDFIERFGAFFESLGVDRTTGRVLGYLLMTTPREQSAADIMDALGVSRGAVSVATRNLTARGYAESRGETGSRKRYFRAREDAWTVGIAQRANDFGRFAEIADFALKNVASLSRSGRFKLREIKEFYLFLEKRFPTLIDEWQKIKAKRK